VANVGLVLLVANVRGKRWLTTRVIAHTGCVPSYHSVPSPTPQITICYSCVLLCWVTSCNLSPSFYKRTI